jgi:hypothetical protein
MLTAHGSTLTCVGVDGLSVVDRGQSRTQDSHRSPIAGLDGHRQILPEPARPVGTPRSNDGIDAGTPRRPLAIFGNDHLPPVRLEGGERGLDRDLHLSGRRRRGTGGWVDRLMTNQE